MKILRTRENGRPHPRAKEKLGSLSRTPLVLPFHSLSLFLRPSVSLPLFLTRPLSLSFSLFSHDTSVHARVYGHVLHGRRRRWRGLALRGGGEGRLIPVPRGSRSTPHLREGVAASQTFRAETRFLTGNFVRLRLPPSPISATAASSSSVARPSLEFFEFSHCTHGQSYLSFLHDNR